MNPSNSTNQVKLRTICIIGLGYVGLPLAILFSKKFPVIGFDICEKRVKELSSGIDRTGEVASEVLRNSDIEFTINPERIRESDVVIVTVPTPVDRHKIPNLGPLKSATRIIGRNIKRGAVVVYESTVYPGATEEECVPILEHESKMKWKDGFHVGYSPERINPGDKEHTVEKITKVVAGDTPEVTDLLAQLYGSVIEAGVYRVSSIRVAEAAKVIENIQRDINIALINELAMLFHKMGLDTNEVLSAAATKWNFLPFKPGLVGGHCIPVDPYYLTYKAQEMGYYPQVILSGRRVNDFMGNYVAKETVRLLIRSGVNVKGSRVLVLGVAFKENVPDVRNSRVVELVKELESFGCKVDVYDPLVEKEQLSSINLIGSIDSESIYDAVVLAVSHRVFLEEYISELKGLLEGGVKVFVDVKGVLKSIVPDSITYWRL